MDKTVTKLLVVFMAAFVAVQYVSTQMLKDVPTWLNAVRIILLVLVIATSFVFSIKYDKQSEETKEKEAPKSLTKNLIIMYLVLAFLYVAFKLRGVI